MLTFSLKHTILPATNYQKQVSQLLLNLTLLVGKNLNVPGFKLAMRFYPFWQRLQDEVQKNRWLTGFCTTPLQCFNRSY